MDRFGLTDTQAEAILELKLRHLAKLEEMRIRGEQSDLAAERVNLEKTLGSATRLKRLVRDELLADAEKFGDERRSAIVVRPPALALDENAILPTEAITVVLSSRGWVRAAKGHDIDPASLSFKAGDQFQAAGLARSNQSVVFLDSTGRTYSLAAHTLPSARGLGEPLAGRINPPDGATFKGVIVGEPDQLILFATDAGYGFMAKVSDLFAKNKAGKAVVNRPAGAEILTPVAVTDASTDRVAAVSSEGHLLVHSLRELPVLARGKGMKIMQIPPAKLKLREAYMQAVTILPQGASLTVFAGKRHVTLKSSDLDLYTMGRGRRGKKLPRGLQKVDTIRAE